MEKTRLELIIRHNEQSAVNLSCGSTCCAVYIRHLVQENSKGTPIEEPELKKKFRPYQKQSENTY